MPTNVSSADRRTSRRWRFAAGTVGILTTLALGGGLIGGAASLAAPMAGTPVAGAPAAETVDAVVEGSETAPAGTEVQLASFNAQASPIATAAAAKVYRFPAKENLNGRAAPRLSAKTLKVDAYRKGNSVPVVCQVSGGSAYGSKIWDKTTDGYYVPDAYVKTGYDGFAKGVPRCKAVSTPTPTPTPTPAPSKNTVNGIDISSHQATLSLKSQYAAGKRFVFIKATEGSTFTSPTFTKQQAAARSAGFIQGAYHFANPAGASGAAQANYFIKHGGGWTADGRTLPGALDIEYSPYKDGKGACYGVSKTAMVTWINDFLTTYKKRTGRDALIYTTTSWWATCTGNTAKFGKNPLWIARYGSTNLPLPNGWTKPLIWQHSDKPIDQNKFYGSLADLKAFAKGTGKVIVTPTTPPPTSTVVKKFKAIESLDGRKTKKLSAAAVKTYRKGSTISIKCQAYGEYAYGSAIWDKTTDNLWVPDHYVKTGRTGFVAGLPKCDNDPKPKDPNTKGCNSSLSPNTCAEAVRWAKARIGDYSSGYYHMCDRIAANAYGHARSGSATAKVHWYSIPAQYKSPGKRTVPAGGLAFFTGNTWGHVMISIGDGKFVSNDIHGNGRLSVTTIAEIEKRWGLQYLGWGQPWFQINHG